MATSFPSSSSASASKKVPKWLKVLLIVAAAEAVVFVAVVGWGLFAGLL
jgi:hypothetical protein